MSIISKHTTAFLSSVAVDNITKNIIHLYTLYNNLRVHLVSPYFNRFPLEFHGNTRGNDKTVAQEKTT